MATTMAMTYGIVQENASIITGNMTDDVTANSTRQDFSMINKVSYGYIMQPICALGILCNVLNLFVLTHKKLSESPYVYLTGLAIADMLSMIFFFLSGFPRAHYPHSYNWKVYEYFVYFTLGGMSTNMSAILTVVLTIERYIFVTFPIKARSICTPRNARIVVLGVFVFSLLFDMPRFFAFKINEDLTVGYTDFGNGKFFEALNWFRLTVLLLGSCLVLTILNMLLIKYVVESNKKRRAVQSISNLKRIRDNNRLTKMLIAIICIYIIGEIPSAFVSRAIIGPLLGKDALHRYSYRIALAIATLLVVLEHSLNFIVYCIYNRKFRAILKSYIIKVYGKKTVEISQDGLSDSKPLNRAENSNTCCGLTRDYSDEGVSQDMLDTERITLDEVDNSMTLSNGQVSRDTSQGKQETDLSVEHEDMVSESSGRGSRRLSSSSQGNEEITSHDREHIYDP